MTLISENEGSSHGSLSSGFGQVSLTLISENEGSSHGSLSGGFGQVSLTLISELRAPVTVPFLPVMAKGEF